MKIEMNYLYLIIPLVILFLIGIRIVRPTERGLIERLGKYKNLPILDFTGLFRLPTGCLWINIIGEMAGIVPLDRKIKEN